MHSTAQRLHACQQYGYRMSKCAAHMAAVSMAAELRASGVAVGIVHPGVVKSGALPRALKGGGRNEN